MTVPLACLLVCQCSGADQIDAPARLPKVLLIGDSIASGYSPKVKELLHGKAEVISVSAGGGHTTPALEKLDDWLAQEKWDVIHFNFGLNDLEGVPPLLPLDQYSQNLRQMTTRLKRSGAKVIWCNTTPFPPGPLSSPRDYRDVPRYNKAARQVMDKHQIVINDLYAFALPRLKELQIKEDVHFSPKGYAELAKEVVRHIEGALSRANVDLQKQLLVDAEPLSVESSVEPEQSVNWDEARADSRGVAIKDGALVLDRAKKGEWTSKWYKSSRQPGVKLEIEAEIDLFDNKTIEVLVKGSETPYTDAHQVPHDWYARCMIAIVDEKRWVMALRSGVDHIQVTKTDTIHLITSSDEGRTWSKLNRWFDGTPIEGMPYEDGHCHSEPGVFKMPNGDLILQFWRTWSHTGTKQMRSTDNGKTWVADIDRIAVVGVTGADDDRVIGTEDYFIDPENPTDVYMAFQYFGYESKGGSLLARSRDNGKSYSFMSWIGPLSLQSDPDAHATFEPAIEYVGNRTIVAVMRDYHTRHTWQSVSADMGATFSPQVDIANQINGGVANGQWQRARIFKESNPYLQHNNPLDYAGGEGRLWGFGIHTIGGYTRKPAVFWSDDNGKSWQGPELLHGPMHPGTDTGYGDIKRRVDNTYVAATYYCEPGNDSAVADLEQYTFGGETAKVSFEADRDADGKPDATSPGPELHNGSNVIAPTDLQANRWRFRLHLGSTETSGSPKIHRVTMTSR